MSSNPAFKNSGPVFQTTDTFQQLVSDLNTLRSQYDSDLLFVDSSLGDLSSLTTTSKTLVGGINELDSDIGAQPFTNLTTDAKTLTGAVNEIDAVFDASAESIVTSGNLLVDANGDIILDANGADVLLRDNGTSYGALTNNSGNLIIKTGNTTAITFADQNATFAGNITMPSTGPGSPGTSSKTVSGAIDEVEAKIPNVFNRSGTLLNP
jgi:hypothetical protein